MTYSYHHVPGHSSMDHFAHEIIILANAENRKTKIGMQSALRRAWVVVRPHQATAPRIDIIVDKGE